MTQAKQTQNTDQNSLQRAVEDARQRAAKAEHELESMRHTVEQLQAAQSSQKNSRGETENIADERLAPEDALQHLRRDDMMAHLLDSLEAGKDIGHYGRLVFAMIARHFLSDEDVTQWLTKDRDFSADDAKAMLRQVEGRDYNPPRRERILAWQKEQEFPILPNADDPDCGNVYRSLKFPQQVYENIQDYQNEKAEASEHAA